MKLVSNIVYTRNTFEFSTNSLDLDCVDEKAFVKILDTKTGKIIQKDIQDLKPFEAYGVYKDFVMIYPKFDACFLKCIERVHYFERGLMAVNATGYTFYNSDFVYIEDKSYGTVINLYNEKTTLFQVVYALCLKKFPEQNEFYITAGLSSNLIKVVANNELNSMIAKARLLGIKPRYDESKIEVFKFCEEKF